jgi:DNA-binding NarL/FixJ family response regulator
MPVARTEDQYVPVRVLVVDDDDGWRLIASTALRRDDIEIVGEAAKGVEAVRSVAETGPEVVLLDVRMPESDGLTALRAIRDGWPEVRVVMCSAEDDHRADALEAGAHAWFTKTDRLEALVVAVTGEPLS